MKLIVGLGNPGPQYEKTRHNVGWRVVDELARKFRIDVSHHEKNALTGSGRVAGGSVMIARPLTYMNLSGDAVRLLANAYLESLQDMIVVYDDIDLPLGRLRLRDSNRLRLWHKRRNVRFMSASSPAFFRNAADGLI